MPLQKVRHFSPRCGRDYALYTLNFRDCKHLAVARDEINWIYEGHKYILNVIYTHSCILTMT